MKDYTVANDANATRVDDTRGKKMEGELLALNNDGVAGVRSCER